MDFFGRTVLVTGASSGIGLGIATAFAQAGAQVALTARSMARLLAPVEELQRQGYLAQGFELEVSSRASVVAACEAVAQHFGGIDILCANAGIYPSAALKDISEEQWDEVFDTNVKGNYLCVQAALPWLEQSAHGRIVLTSSITGPLTGISGYTHYGASKAAQLGFMRGAVMELAHSNITINAVLPGVILTESLKGLGEEFIQSAAAIVPVGRLGTPADIANAALFFAADASGFITGQTLVVDGGQILPEAPASF